MDAREELEMNLSFATSDDMVNLVAFAIFSSVASVTKCFGNINVKIDPQTQRVFIAISLRWYGRLVLSLPWFGHRFKKVWLAEADIAASKHVPAGWKFLSYYKQGL